MEGGTISERILKKQFLKIIDLIELAENRIL
jgi:hypothetical protein